MHNMVGYPEVKPKARALLRLALPQAHTQGVHFVDLMDRHCACSDLHCNRGALYIPSMGLDHETAEHWLRQSRSLELEIDTASGQLTLCRGDEPLAGWIRERLPLAFQEKACLSKLRKRTAEVRQWKHPDAWQKLDWSHLERGCLLSYRVARPATPIQLFHDGADHFALEGFYCWNPDCNCTEMALHLVWVDKSRALGSLRYDYALKRLLAVEESTIPESQLRALAHTAIERLPDFSALAHQRGRFMAREFGAFVHQHFFRSASSPAPAAKAGRNDPCPCGSGKKYKKCCLGPERSHS